MYTDNKVKKRTPLYLSKIDERIKKKIKKEADSRGISPWLLVEHLLAEALGIGKDATSTLFKK